MFEINKEVVCIKKDQWQFFNPDKKRLVENLGLSLSIKGPKYNEIVIISEIDIREKNTIFLVFVEYPNQSFHSKWFRLLIDDSVLEDELSKIETQILV